MKSFQFTVSVSDEGFNIELHGKLTPIVIAENFSSAMKDESLIEFCRVNKCAVYKQVGK